MVSGLQSNINELVGDTWPPEAYCQMVPEPDTHDLVVRHHDLQVLRRDGGVEKHSLQQYRRRLSR